MKNLIKIELSIPNQITPERISFLINQKGIMPNIASIDLEMVKMKISLEEEGEGWSKEKCEEIEVEYKRFLQLNKKFLKSAIVPTDVIDTMWHYHILDTRSYHKDSESVFGGYFHHFPYFGLRGENDKQNLSDSFDITKEIYQNEFGEKMLRNEHTGCWHDCEGRCWHACSSNDKLY
jgi:hypothetical protein